ncbi:MAG TPA: dephospho-CoA kinase [Saprospiraceae bacterium]|nr:dephospho-CoA kinase [Saprospiraceae bacterium]
MIKVGITGGIGSGKTTVCKIFETFSVPVYYADDRAKKLMTGHKELKNSIIQLLGKQAYFNNGKLNRKYIAELVFNDRSYLERLNKLVHPAVAKDGEEWFKHQAKIGYPYALKEAALLIESGSFKMLDKLIVVTAPIDIRIERVMQRDKVSQEKVEARIRQQMKEEERIRYADFVIDNTNKSMLDSQVLHIHNQLMQMY